MAAKGKEIERGGIQADSLVEKFSLGEVPSSLAIIGRYVLRPEIFRY